MAGHQQQYESDIRTKQKNKHTRQRPYNRMLTDAHECRRLSSLAECMITAQYGDEQFPIKNINKVINQVIIYGNKIPRSIVLYTFKAEKCVKSGYTRSINNLVFFQNDSCITNDVSEARWIPQEKSCCESVVKYKAVKQCGWSGTNVTELFMFINLLYEIWLKLQLKAQKSIRKHNVQYNLCIRSAELRNLRKLLNPIQKYSNNIIEIKENGPRKNMQILKHENIDARNSIRFIMTIESLSTKFFLSLGKSSILSFTILGALQKCYCTTEVNLTCETSNNVPCLIYRSWHFRNIIQGHLLGILLRNININSLNTMRQLYYVIITSFNGNHVLETTIKLNRSIFMVYDNSLYQEVIDWIKPYNLFIKKTDILAALETLIHLKRFDGINRENQLIVISYANLQESQSQYFNTNMLMNCPFRTASEEDCYHSNDSCDSVSLQSKDSEISTFLLQKCPSSMYLVKPDKAKLSKVTQTVPLLMTCSAFITKTPRVYNYNFLHSKLWIQNVFPINIGNDTKEMAQLTDMTPTFNYESIKETIFDNTSTYIKRLESVTDMCWKQMNSQSFYMLFLKSIGRSLVSTFFYTVL